MTNRLHFVEIEVSRGQEVASALNHYASDGYVIEATTSDRIIMSKKINEKIKETKADKKKEKERGRSEPRENGGERTD